MKKKIVSTHIENDVVNGQPTLVFIDEDGQEWVHEDQPMYNGAYVTVLKKKTDSWFFKPENKANKG
jgi:hypothetical protein